MSAKKRDVTRMNTEDLVKETADLDEEFIADTFRPPPADAGEEWKSARLKRGRPQKGEGAKVISISVERQLLARSDRLARSLGISRAALVAHGLEAALALVGKEEDQEE